MKIAFFLSSKNIVSHDRGGGVEYFSYYLTQELARRGHNISVYAAPGSKIPGVNIKTISPFPTNIDMEYANLQERITSFYDLSALSDFFVSGEWKKFDLVQYNNYIFYEILPFVKLADIPVIIHIHYSHKTIYPSIKDKLLQFKNIRYLPVSDFTKTLMPELPYLDKIYPAIDLCDFPYSENHDGYLLYLSRICPEKGAHLAVKSARQAGKKLVIAGGVSRSHYAYFNTEIKPYIDNKNIIYVGEVDLKTRVKIYQKAAALLFPIQWDETFGLVMAEAQACGTPVIAFDRAASREIINDGVSGFVVPDGDVNAMAAAAGKTDGLDRRKARTWAEENFSIVKWAEKYENICEKLKEKH
ncbi:MAG: glycosyltransferase [Candidatus Falkowbacteria bacterium]